MTVTTQGSRAPTDETVPEGPIWSGELEIYAGRMSVLELPSDHGYVAARLLVRAAGVPIGFVDVAVDDDRVDLDEAAGLARAQFGKVGGPDSDWLAPQPDSVSVVLCTRNRTEGARACLESLRRTRHPALEIILVDNAPSDETTQVMVDELSALDPRVRYVREPRPGLSVARNRGLAEATGEIVAFTDDDVIVDPLWLNGLLRGFNRRQGIACVTGIVVSASLRYPAERYFDRRVWWSSRCVPAIYDFERGSGDPAMHPYAAGQFGTGANFAFRRSVLIDMGGFDNSLGAGSLTQGGEDLDAFVRVLRAGHAICYEPAALVRHYHRVSFESIVRQMRDYGLGLGAYLTKYLISRRTRGDLLVRLGTGLAHARVLADRSAAATEDPELRRAVQRSELIGLLLSPFMYLRSRRRQGRAHIRATSP